MYTAVPCSQSHTGEVFFSGDIWPQSLAYPGDNRVDNQAHARCDRAFTAHDGIPPDPGARSSVASVISPVPAYGRGPVVHGQAGPGRGTPSRTSWVREVMPSLVKTFRRW